MSLLWKKTPVDRRQMTVQQRYWKLFTRMCQFHEQHASWGSAHDLFHDLMVAGYALVIADDLSGDSTELHEAAWVAAMLHSIDRFIPDATDQTDFLRDALDWCPENSAVIRWWHNILSAVLNHNKPNDDADEPITIILKDADRLANINPLVIVRAAQSHHGLPPTDPRWLGMRSTPDSTYSNPLVITDGVFSSTEWETWLRLPTAKRIAAKYFDHLWHFYQLIAVAHDESGIGFEMIAASAPVAAYLAAMDAARRK